VNVLAGVTGQRVVNHQKKKLALPPCDMSRRPTAIA